MSYLNDELEKMNPDYLESIKIIETLEHYNDLNSNFSLDNNVETFFLKGNYNIYKYVNEDKSEKDNVRHYHCKLVFSVGIVLFNNKVPNIEKLIKLLIYYTYNSPPVRGFERKQMVGGTVCPTKEVIYEIGGKQFILYGRYIFGYNQRYVQFKSINNPRNKFKLAEIKQSERVNDYNYAFVIINKDTNILDAFGLYC